MPLPSIDTEYLTSFLVDLLNIPSPTGFTEDAIAFVEKELSAYPQLRLSRTRKGALLAAWVKFFGAGETIIQSILAGFLLDNFPLVLGLLPQEFDAVRSFFQ